MKITDATGTPPKYAKPIELKFCLKSGSMYKPTRFGEVLPWFGKTVELIRLSTVKMDDGVMDLIKEVRDYGTFIWMGHWNDGAAPIC